MSRRKRIRKFKATEELQLAGIDLSQSGPYLRPRGITVTPKVQIMQTDNGQALYWNWEDIDSYSNRMNTNGALEEFSGLEGVRPEGVLRFAKAWGPLGLCEHGKPATHNRPTFLERPSPFHCGEINPEPIIWWEHWVRQAAALMRIVGHLYRGERPPAKEWRAVYESSDAPQEAPWWEPTIAADRIALSHCVREWVELANLVPVPALWREPRLELEFHLSAFGAVARDLMFLSVRADRLSRCSECGTFYVPKRRPDSRRRSFCIPCRESGAPSKHSSRSYRARQAL